MSTTTRRPRPPAAPPGSPAPLSGEGDQRIVIRGLSWDLYDRLSDAIGEGQHVRLAFDGEDLEIMTTGPVHEDYKEMLGQIVGTVSKTLGIPRKKLGETTWKRPEITRGIEADQCFSIGSSTKTAVTSSSGNAGSMTGPADCANVRRAFQPDPSTSGFPT